MKHKFLSLLLAIIVSTGTMNAEIVNGTCGDNLTWTLNSESRTLVIEGSGAMTDWIYGSPWSKNIIQVSLPDGLTTIGQNAFNECTDLTNITIPNSVIAINDAAFYRSGLVSIEIPSNVASIGELALCECWNLQSIDVAANNSNYRSIGGVLFNKQATTLIQCPNARDLTSYKIPSSVLHIGISAFSYCNVGNLVIPDNVQTIGEGAFHSCVSTSVIIGDGVISIGEEAFRYCSLRSITIGKNIQDINRWAFFSCHTDTLIIYATLPPNVDNCGIEPEDCILYVPAESVDTYANTSWWKTFREIKPINEGSNYNINYLDKDESTINTQLVALILPDAPAFAGFTFLKWVVVAGDLEDGINIQATYQANEPSSAPDIVINPSNPSQKLIRNGNVFVLYGDKTYTLQGQQVK